MTSDSIDLNREYNAKLYSQLPKQIVRDGWIYRLERRFPKSHYVKYVKKYKLMLGPQVIDKQQMWQCLECDFEQKESFSSCPKCGGEEIWRKEDST